MTFQHLQNLKELRCGRFDEAVDLETLAKNLTNLEMLSMTFPTIKNVLPFVRHSKKLHSLNFLEFSSDDHHRSDEVGIPTILAALNKERQKLKEELQGLQIPKVVTVHFESERSYLATKWQLKNVRFDLIDIKRPRESWV